MSPKVVLVGLPGAGKSTSGRRLARILCVPFADSDDLVETATGRQVTDIFAESGEGTFRALEADAIVTALTDFDGVLALGGGALTTEATRQALSASDAPVVVLRATLDTLGARVGDARTRPLLAADPPGRLAALADEREPLYRSVATLTVDTDGRTPGQVAAAVAARLHERGADVTTTRIEVAGAAPYPVLVGHGITAEVGGLLGRSQRVAVLHPPTLADRAEALRADLAAQRFDVHLIALPDGEDAKTLAVAGHCWDTLGELGFTRSDAVVGLGGGATTDLAGWVAASWLRGVQVVHVATTLAGMVDAAVGGKTGINTARGKNLVGAFHPPAGVVCDLDVLGTLPADDYRAGLAEVVKCGFIADPVILDLVEADPAAALRAGNASERELVERSVRIKAHVVGEDLTDRGVREILNYGHTLGHAVERAERYRWRHGDAVSVGLVYAAALARRLGRLDDATADRHGAVLRALGLPTSYAAAAYPALLETMRIDKKARGNRLRFVVLDGLAAPVTIDEPDADVLSAAYSEVAL